MGVEHPDKGGQACVSSGNTLPKQASNPPSGTTDTNPAPFRTLENRTRMPHKKDWREVETVLLTEEGSAVIQRTLPEKLQDLESFVIPCTLEDGCTRKVLCDLGASINLMPSSLIRKLGIKEVKPTRICLQLADGSTKFSSGVVEDLIVRVGPFVFTTDFIVLNMEEHKNVSIILERPFLATGRTLIDVQKREVTLRVDEDEFVLNATKVM
ncbi:uncharacterized protein LOC130949911 [Arachis stenosperma]|uniref:uncharacterized protein LOC130949911 n=1 Tax=Arachis stenosperma TaxID=217475 RepID=UPI0025ACE32C|nr:uncharacterized protein LOC130949911 [Arachis stenosperma]